MLRRKDRSTVLRLWELTCVYITFAVHHHQGLQNTAACILDFCTGKLLSDRSLYEFRSQVTEDNRRGLGRVDYLIQQRPDELGPRCKQFEHIALISHARMVLYTLYDNVLVRLVSAWLLVNKMFFLPGRGGRQVPGKPDCVLQLCYDLVSADLPDEYLLRMEESGHGGNRKVQLKLCFINMLELRRRHSDTR